MAYLFKTIQELRQYVTAANSAKIELWEPHIRVAQERHLKPILGKDQLQRLVDGHNASNLTPAEELLLVYAQAATANYAAWVGFPMMSVKFSDMGVTEASSKDGSASPTRQWVAESVRSHFLQAADIAAEELLQFLESDPGSYPLWVSGEGCTTSRELLLQSATQLADYIDTRGSRRVYLSLRPFIKNFVERQWILPWICTEMMAELKARQLAGTLTAEDVALLERIKPVVAYAALGMMATTVNVWLTGDGLRMPSSGNYFEGSGTKESPVELRQQFASQMKSMADASLTELQRFIAENIADYPTIAAGDCNPVTGKVEPWVPPAQASKGSFMAY